MSNDSTTDDAPAPAMIPSARPGERSPERRQWLFRDALRQQRVHPLMELLCRHHEASAR